MNLLNSRAFKTEEWKPMFLSIPKGGTVRITLGEPVTGTAQYDEKEKLVVQWRVYTVEEVPVEQYWRTASRSVNFELGKLWDKSGRSVIRVAVKRDVNGRYTVIEV